MSLRQKLSSRCVLIRKLARITWGSSVHLRISALALVYSTAEYCSPFWNHCTHTIPVDRIINSTLRIRTECLKPTPGYTTYQQSLAYPLFLLGVMPPHLGWQRGIKMRTTTFTSNRLTSRWPISRSLALLNSTIKPDESIISSWLERTWTEQLSSKDSLPGVPGPQAECLKIDLSRTLGSN